MDVAMENITHTSKYIKHVLEKDKEQGGPNNTPKDISHYSEKGQEGGSHQIHQISEKEQE